MNLLKMKKTFNKEEMEESLKMKILKKCFRLKSDDNSRVNVNDKFNWLEEQGAIYKVLYSMAFFMLFKIKKIITEEI